MFILDLNPAVTWFLLRIPLFHHVPNVQNLLVFPSIYIYIRHQYITSAMLWLELMYYFQILVFEIELYIQHKIYLDNG